MIDIYLAFVIDALVGDPQWFPHPVRLIGRYISIFEGFTRKIISSSKGLKISGVLITLTTVALSYTIAHYTLEFFKGINTWVYHFANVLIMYTCLATRCLADEALKIYRVLKTGDIQKSRKMLSYIVGRDTQNLDESGIARATVETVAENASDGVVAPLVYMIIGGAPLALAYKAINTLDSMVGYKNDKYENLGWASAKLDDIANYIPARLTALLMIISAFVLGMDYRNSWRIFRRDNQNHKSPNSGCPEAATAGALRIQLGGTNMYFGKPVEKPTIGDNTRLLVKKDIISTIMLMYGASIAGVIILTSIYFLWEKLI
jgi:adenosylcobinamide-phosphate synthase